MGLWKDVPTDVYTRSGHASFEWDEHNAEHVRRHSVEPAHAEAALLDPDRLAVVVRNTNERRWGLIGATEQGWVLFVVFTVRGGAIRVVTAREAIAREKRRYRRGRGG